MAERWRTGAVDQAGRAVVVEAPTSVDAVAIIARWLSSNGVPVFGVVERYHPTGLCHRAGLLVVRDVDGELEERALTLLEIVTS